MGEDGLGDETGRRVRAAILDYLDHNRAAADSIRGIMNWWLPPETRTTDVAVVERVLEQLVASGLVTATALADGTVFYRRLVKNLGAGPPPT